MAEILEQTTCVAVKTVGGACKLTEDELWERRCQVAHLRAKGLSFSEVGRQLGIRYDTASNDFEQYHEMAMRWDKVWIHQRRYIEKFDEVIRECWKTIDDLRGAGQHQQLAPILAQINRAIFSQATMLGFTRGEVNHQPTVVNILKPAHWGLRRELLKKANPELLAADREPSAVPAVRAEPESGTPSETSQLPNFIAPPTHP